MRTKAWIIVNIIVDMLYRGGQSDHSRSQVSQDVA